MEAISHAGTVLAVMSKEGIAMAAEKASTPRSGCFCYTSFAHHPRKSLASCLISPLHPVEKVWAGWAPKRGPEAGRRSFS